MKIEEKIDENDIYSAVGFMEKRLKIVEQRGLYSKCIKIAERIIKLNFSSQSQLERAIKPLSGILTNETSTIDTEFFYWRDDLVVRQGHMNFPQNVWRIKKENDDINFCFDGDLGVVLVLDKRKRKFYYCESEASLEERFVGESISRFFMAWSDLTELFFVHSALIGYEGKGVLLIGFSGAGKSTLAISSLLAGCDFVSDDCIFLSGTLPLTGFPVYSTVGICPDMEDKLLKKNMKILRLYRDRGGKKQVDISAYKIKDKLEIKAIILVQRTPNETPRITVSDGQKAKARLIYSTVTQFDKIRNQQFIKKLGALLQTLPAYDFHITEDLDKNQKFLQNFIQNYL